MTASLDPKESRDFDSQRLRQLTSAWCDESISDAEAEELEALLSQSASARTLYVQYVSVHAGLEWEITSSESIASLLPATSPPPVGAGPTQSPRRLGPPKMWSFAAALVMVASLGVWGSYALNRSWSMRKQAAKPPVQGESASRPTQVASVKRLGANAQWAVTPHPDASPMELREHDVVCVTEGEIQVTFNCGADVTLYAPAMMEVLSPMKGRAIRGRLAATVHEGAQGFTIETPQATVVDLGTIFGVEVGDEGATDVVVFKGAVDLHFDRAAADSRERPLRLTSGEAMRLDKQGTPSRIVSIYSDRFSSQPDMAKDQLERPVLISAVTDNIDRARESWNYYEIVHGGMGEDAKAFVDRVAHEWNGLDGRGMPKFLLGGDYVKTFNNDKYSKDLELFISIDRPCRLYVLIDDRVPPPAWLEEQFEDAGVDIGLDVGPFHRVEDGVLIDDRVPGVGPGVRVDNVFSIWQRTINEPQIVHLGANEAAHRYINMYGIVAVPLDE